MTRFATLCGLYADNIEEYHRYKQKCWDLVDKILRNLVEYLDIPSQDGHYLNEEFIKVIPISKQDEPLTSVYTIPGSVEFGEDCLWHLGIVLIFRKTLNTKFPVDNVLIHLKIKLDREKDLFLVSFGDQKPLGVTVESPAINQIRHLNENIYKAIEQHYRSFQTTLYKEGDEESSQAIGFQLA